jgi:hypothetical protein
LRRCIIKVEGKHQRVSNQAQQFDSSVIVKIFSGVRFEHCHFAEYIAVFRSIEFGVRVMFLVERWRGLPRPLLN